MHFESKNLEVSKVYSGWGMYGCPYSCSFNNGQEYFPPCCLSNKWWVLYLSIFLRYGFCGESINAISKFEYLYFKVRVGYEG